MAEHERRAHDIPEAERYHAECWKLVSVAHDPTRQRLFLVWDTTGFFSG